MAEDTKSNVIIRAQQALKDLEAIPDLMPFAQDLREIIDEINRGTGVGARSLDKLTEAVERYEEAVETARDGSDDLERSLQGLDRQTENLIERMTGVRQSTNATFIESFGNAIKNTKSLRAAMGQMAETAQETLTTFNVGIATVRKFAEGTALLTQG